MDNLNQPLLNQLPGNLGYNPKITAQAPLVLIKLKQGYNVNLNINIVSSHAFPHETGTILYKPSPYARTPFLQGKTFKKLVQGEKLVLAWLGEDKNNLDLFVQNPLAILSKAGVNLTYPDMKAIESYRAHNSSHEVVAPGLQLRKVKFSLKHGKTQKHKRPNDNTNDSEGRLNYGAK